MENIWYGLRGLQFRAKILHTHLRVCFIFFFLACLKSKMDWKILIHINGNGEAEQNAIGSHMMLRKEMRWEDGRMEGISLFHHS